MHVVLRIAISLLALTLCARPARAQVTLAELPPGRTELLYSTDDNVNCSELFKTRTTGHNLPFNVVRLQAEVAGAPGSVRYSWSMKPAVGTLVADLDLGPQEQTPAIVGLCSDFGNECVLTPDRLRFYNESSILWVAPTCDVLPDNTARAFRGGATRIKVKVTSGRRRLGQATAQVGFGRTGTVTLFVNPGFGPGFQNGIGKPNGVSVPVNPIFAASASPPVPGPGSVTPPGPGPVTQYALTDMSGARVALPTCRGAPFDACGEVILKGDVGPITMAAKFDDGSALCDKLFVRVIHCSAKPRLEVLPQPRRAEYDPDSSNSNVNLVVRLRNLSQPVGDLRACTFLLQGADMLTCTAQLKVGQIKDTSNTRFGLSHCSRSTSLGCDSDGECRPPFCDGCDSDEVCLQDSHCSQTFQQPCSSDADCDPDAQPPTCPTCDRDETCLHILNVPSGSRVIVQPGESVDLINQPVQLKNEFTDPAIIRDAWIVRITIPPDLIAVGKYRYRIRARPK